MSGMTEITNKFRDERDDFIGGHVLNLLMLRKKRENGRIDTLDGDKTARGLARTLRRYLSNSDLPGQYKVYTVILLYPEYATEDYGADIYVNCSVSPDPEIAVREVQQMAAAANAHNDPLIGASDFRPIAVIDGEVTLELDATCF